MALLAGILTAPELSDDAGSLPPLQPDHGAAAERGLRWRKETNDAASWAGIESGATETTGSHAPRTDDASNRRELETQVDPIVNALGAKFVVESTPPNSYQATALCGVAKVIAVASSATLHILHNQKQPP